MELGLGLGLGFGFGFGFGFRFGFGRTLAIVVEGGGQRTVPAGEAVGQLAATREGQPVVRVHRLEANGAVFGAIRGALLSHWGRHGTIAAKMGALLAGWQARDTTGM